MRNCGGSLGPVGQSWPHAASWLPSQLSTSGLAAPAQLSVVGMPLCDGWQGCVCWVPLPWLASSISVRILKTGVDTQHLLFLWASPQAGSFLPWVAGLPEPCWQCSTQGQLVCPAFRYCSLTMSSTKPIL